MHRRSLLLVVAGLVGAAGWWFGQPAARPAGKVAVDPAAVERTLTTVRMLDDLYKGFVVNITATYVKAQEHTPAATAAKKVFRHMEKQGWQKTRLVDATGKPFSEDNLPKTGFEKRAVAKLKSGKTYYEEIATANGRPVLRAATVVPVVMKQCLNCHTHAKEGDLLGALVYEVPIK